MTARLKVSLRQNAVYVPSSAHSPVPAGAQGNRAGQMPSPETATLVYTLSQLGFGLTEPLLRALDQAGPEYQAQTLQVLREVTGVDKNWTPLVRGWDVPTGESRLDHFITWIANLVGMEGTRLACGHTIPPGTFLLKRYTGCPFCGTPFEQGAIEKLGQGSTLKVLELWTDLELNGFLADLLGSKTPLDATQRDSLKLLLSEMPLPTVPIGMKETVATVVDILVEAGKPDDAQPLFTSPTDILRYLWYKHTGFVQLVQPKVVARRKGANQRHVTKRLDKSAAGRLAAKQALKLKYTRPEGLRVAQWLNRIELPIEQQAENMHPKRELWVRFIRALRLTEHSHRPGFERLRALLEVFYHQRYPVIAGRIESARLRKDAAETLRLLKARPGLLARSLLANMLWFGPDAPLDAFREVVDKVPLRLVFSLTMYARTYFNRNAQRLVRPVAGSPKTIPPHPLLKHYTDEQLDAMLTALTALCVEAAKARYAQAGTVRDAQADARPYVQANIEQDAGEGATRRSITIDPLLYKMPIPISDRSDTIQDLPCALMGTRFSLEGHAVRLFMQWGMGLKAQHMDMDLSCRVVFPDRVETCYFSQLTTTGCKHSGDMRAIPDQVGTAEYVEIDVDTLQKKGALYALFTCNAYSRGELTMNLVVGWMNSRHPMVISADTGVAYDPSCVQHQVRISTGLAKGLVFGVLLVPSREIVWLELPFDGQLARQVDRRSVEALLARLEDKLSIGALLQLRAEALGLEIRDAEPADEIYSRSWARNSAGVTRLLLGN